jgi:transcriptional regulator GlxA family with amidase domain
VSAQNPGSVAVAVTDGIPILELAVLCEVFGIARRDLADPWYEFRICAADPGRTQVGSGFIADTTHDFGDLVNADTVVVSASANVLDKRPAELIDAVVEGHRRGARIVSICAGAFVLAAAGLLDGRRATTHWMHAPLLARRFPNVDVDPSVLYIDDGDILTGAGGAAALDLCLHVVRRDLGPDVANAVARRMVTPTPRPGGQAQDVQPGGQAQGIESPWPTDGGDGLAPLLDWMLGHLGQPLTVSAMARRAHLGDRTLIRQFQTVTGSTPLRWLIAQRVRRARQLLESSDLSVDRIATEAGLGSPANLRRHFTRSVGLSPSDYRRIYRLRHSPQRRGTDLN